MSRREAALRQKTPEFNGFGVKRMRAAIVGGGLAGLAAALRLQTAGADVHVFDKGRGPGGRMSTRRAHTSLGELRFDHGAQFFTARDPGFQAVVAELQKDGHVAEWTGVFHLDGGPDPRPDTRYVGAPGMNGIIRGLAARVSSIEWGRRVEAVEGAPGKWRLKFDAGDDVSEFDAVVIATPAEQAGPLLQPIAPGMAAEAEAARSAPCWSIMLAFDSLVETKFDGARWSKPAGNSPISWAARNASKPGRGDVETWIVHGSPDWSRVHLEWEPDAAAEALVKAFCEMTGATAPIHAAAHRWRYSQIETSAQSAFGWDAALGVGCCGDWRLGPRVECAWMSGDALGEAMAARI
ncbi:MAG: FAD-dependent oxidoreductase [Pseudomonadota bacterium]